MSSWRRAVAAAVGAPALDVVSAHAAGRADSPGQAFFDVSAVRAPAVSPISNAFPLAYGRPRSPTPDPVDRGASPRDDLSALLAMCCSRHARLSRGSRISLPDQRNTCACSTESGVCASGYLPRGPSGVSKEANSMAVGFFGARRECVCWWKPIPARSGQGCCSRPRGNERRTSTAASLRGTETSAHALVGARDGSDDPMPRCRARSVLDNRALATRLRRIPTVGARSVRKADPDSLSDGVAPGWLSPTAAERPSRTQQIST